MFRICGRDDVQGRVAGDLLAERFGKRAIAIVHENAIYGEGLAAETKKRLNEHGVQEVMLEAIAPGQAEYSDIVHKMQAAGIQVVYYAGFRREAGLIMRQAHERGYRPQLVASDGIGGEDFALVAGPAADGTLMTYAPSPLNNKEAAALAERFAAEGYAGTFGLGTFRSYAVVQAWAQAVEKAGTFETAAVAEALRSHEFETVLGRIGFDDKGDVTGYETFVWYVWKDGTYTPVDPAEMTE